MNYPMLDDGTRDWCRTCAHYVGACESDCTYQRNENGLDYDKEPTMYQQKPISNADKLRSMSDEELADWLGVYCNGQTAQEVGKPCVSGMGSCEECWLDWLKQEVSTDG